MGGRRLSDVAVLAGLACVALAAPAISGCDNGMVFADCVCTEEFRSFIVTVIDGEAAPVDSMDVVVTRTRDGLALSGQNLGSSPGTYTIIDDASIDAVGRGGEAIRVVASKNGTSVSGDYVFAADDCLCHVDKVSGPDTLVWGVGS